MTQELDRRTLIEGMGIAAVATMAAAISVHEARAQGAPGAAYEMMPLPIDPAGVPGMSERLIVSHYENNYGGAVRRLNTIVEQLANLNWETAPNFQINGLKREELMATNSMILHEHFFAALAGGGDPTGALGEAIARDFGSIERWRAEFSAMGRAQGGGSGWVILAYSQRDGRLLNCWAADHTTTLAGGRPVLVLDMYEHAYHMDYGTGAAGYVEAYMGNIRWEDASAAFVRYSAG